MNILDLEEGLSGRPRDAADRIAMGEYGSECVRANVIWEPPAK